MKRHRRKKAAIVTPERRRFVGSQLFSTNLSRRGRKSESRDAHDRRIVGTYLYAVRVPCIRLSFSSCLPSTSVFAHRK
jgi:hypothetical protein